jgi:hypothetical protein
MKSLGHIMNQPLSQTFTESLLYLLSTVTHLTHQQLQSLPMDRFSCPGTDDSNLNLNTQKIQSMIPISNIVGGSTARLRYSPSVM